MLAFCQAEKSQNKIESKSGVALEAKMYVKSFYSTQFYFCRALPVGGESGFGCCLSAYVRIAGAAIAASPNSMKNDLVIFRHIMQMTRAIASTRSPRHQQQRTAARTEKCFAFEMFRAYLSGSEIEDVVLIKSRNFNERHAEAKRCFHLLFFRDN